MSAKVSGWVWDLGADRVSRDEKIVLLAYADHADHFGNNIFPSIALVASMTLYDPRSVQRITRKLEAKELLIPVSGQRGGRGVVPRWRIPVPWKKGDNLSPIEDEERVTEKPQRVTKRPIKGDTAISPEPSTTSKPPRGLVKKGDLVDGYLALSRSPGIKRIARLNDILSEIGKKVRINTTGKAWEKFAKFVDDRQQVYNESLAVFLDYLVSKPNFDIQYWMNPERWQTIWPQAFPDTYSEPVQADSDGFAPIDYSMGGV